MICDDIFGVGKVVLEFGFYGTGKLFFVVYYGELSSDDATAVDSCP